MEDTTGFGRRVAAVLSGELRADDIVSVCATPELMREVGFAECDVVMTQKHIRNCLAAEDPSGKEHRHDLPIDFMDDLPRYIQSPAMILASMTREDSVVLVTDRKDKRDRPIVIALKNAGKGTVGGKVIDCNVVMSTYGRNGFSEFLNNSLKNNCLLYCDIKKSRDLVVSAGLRLPGLLADHDSMDIIRRYNENVNTFKQKYLKNPKNFMPERYGQTLYRPDGLPLAYTDADGRQRVVEYGNGADGSPFVAKTSVTLSDGRGEVTCYDARGRITQLERSSPDGAETYSYSTDGFGRSSERSITSDGNASISRKIEHEKIRDRIEERGWMYDRTKESWNERDERGNVLLSKHNVYGNNGKLHSTHDVKYEYDRYGNVTSAEYGDGSVYKTEYYPPSMVRDYFGLDIEDYDAGAVDHDKVKTMTSRYADGQISIKQYTLENKYTESEYSPDGKLMSFRNESGEVFQGKAAERALLISSGQAPTRAEVKKSAEKKMTSTSAKTAAASKTDKSKKPTAKAPLCKGCNATKSGRDGGAGR